MVNVVRNNLNMKNNSPYEDLPSVGRSWTRTFLKVTALGLSLLLVVPGGVLWLAQQTPAFYPTSLEMSDEEAFAAGESLEVAALYLRNDVMEEDTWVAEFSEHQINGWLASDLPRKFSTFRSEEIRDPRVDIEPGKFKIALTTEIKNVETVVVAAIEFFPTGITNEFGLRVLSVHAGWLPIPISFFTKRITEVLERNHVQIRWYNDSDGLPVALATVPKHQLRYQGKQIVIEQLEIADGAVRLAGRSERLTEKSDPDSNATDSNAIQPVSDDSKIPVATLVPVSD